MACWMGLDFGTVRTGVAFADDEVGLPTPFGLVMGAASERVRQIAVLAQARDVNAIVLGLPLSLRGEEGAAALRVRRFAKLLQHALPNAELHFFDERYSTQAIEAGRARDKRSKKEVDAAAAAWVLQAFLEARASDGGKNT